MKRRALLIAESPKSEPVPGVYQDISSWSEFLISSQGGVWSESEIVTVIDSDRGKLLDAVAVAKNADYSLIVFAGHGQTVKGELPWLETQVLLSSGEIMSERELNPGTASCTMVLDVCRMGPGIEVPARVKKGALLEAEVDPVKCRALYTQALEKAERGLVSVYSTGVGTAASDAPSFSQYLIHSANEWAETNRGILTLREAVSLASEAMAVKNPQQKPEYNGGRRLRHFPFVVHA